MSSVTQLMEGRCAIVTGAGRGLGEAIAVRLAAEGMRVAVNDIDAATATATAKRCTELGGEAIAVPGDVSDADDIAEVVVASEAAFGGLDILVNNAGIEHRAPIADHGADQWRRVVDVNLTAPFQMTRESLPLLRRSDGAAIVNICSVAVIGTFGQAAYDASKGGLITLTRSLAVELGRDGIRVNAVCPGFIETDMIDAELRIIGERHVRTLPIARFGQPDEVAAAVAWLASAEASYITGHSLFVDGGWVRW